MKTTRINRLVAVLVGVVVIGIFAADASAMYHPGMGTFMQRDPGAGNQHRLGAGGQTAATSRFIPRDPTGSNQYADGMNLYQYVGSNPIGFTDPLGLWKIDRKSSDSWASATAEKSDTIVTLASKVKLDMDEFVAWTRLPKGVDKIKTDMGPLSIGELRWIGLSDGGYSNPSEVNICPGEKVLVPNTVLILKGKLGFLGHIVHNGKTHRVRSAFALLKGGWDKHKVEEKSVGSAEEFKAAVRNRDELYGFLFTGHGAASGYLNPANRNVPGVLLAPSDVSLAHKIRYISLYACFSAEDWPNGWEQHLAPGGKFEGRTGEINWWSSSLFDFSRTITE